MSFRDGIFLKISCWMGINGINHLIVLQEVSLELLAASAEGDDTWTWVDMCDVPLKPARIISQILDKAGLFTYISGDILYFCGVNVGKNTIHWVFGYLGCEDSLLFSSQDGSVNWMFRDTRSLMWAAILVVLIHVCRWVLFFILDHHMVVVIMVVVEVVLVANEIPSSETECFFLTF